MWGAFLQTDIALTDKWNLTLGGRYSYEEKDVDINQFLASGCGGTIGDSIASCKASPDTFSDDEDWDNFTPKVGMQYFINDDMQVYGSYTRGFRSGGFNIRQNAGTSPGPYDEETVDAYELGVKTDLFDRRVRLNGAVFYNEFDDLQRTVISSAGTQSVSNAGEAEVYGAEVELTWLITEHLLLQTNVGYIDTEIKDFDTGNGVIDGTEIPFVPEWQGAASLTYDIPLDFGTVTMRGTYAYFDETQSTDDNQSFQSESYETVDASIGLAMDNGWKFTVFGRNLTDEVRGGQITAAPGLVTLENQPTRPINYGLEVLYEF